jgi:anti-sigma regulatory factor (Ser/Thr protein kinase)
VCTFNAAWQLARGDFVSAAKARVAFRASLGGICSSRSDLDAAEIIFGELVTNALRYSGSDVTAAVFCSGPRVLLEVRDHGKGFDPVEIAKGKRRGDIDGGRGLMIARRLATNFRIATGHADFTVEAELPVFCVAAAAARAAVEAGYAEMDG